MTREKWKENGESIKFQQANGDGIERLLDGQHRLAAVIRINKPIKMLVVRNLPPEVFYTIDAGRKRTAADVLCIAGYKDSTTLAAATRILCCFEQDHEFKLRYKQVPSIDIMSMLERFPEIQESVNLGHKGRFIVPGSMLVFMHYITSIDNPDHAIEFITKLTEGVSMLQGDPILTFRDRMFRYKSNNVRLRRQFLVALLFKTWNYSFDGQSIEKLKFGVAEEFPILKGFDRKKMFGSDYPEPNIKEDKKDTKQPTLF